MLTKTDRNGIATTNVYTPLGQLKSSSNANETVTYTYDKKGNVKTVSGNNANISYTYDGFGRTTNETVVSENTTVSNNYTYDIINLR